MNDDKSAITAAIQERQPGALAQILYDAYCTAVGGTAYDGKPLPTWAEFIADSRKEKQASAWKLLGSIFADTVRERAVKAAVETGIILLYPVDLAQKFVGSLTAADEERFTTEQRTSLLKLRAALGTEMLLTVPPRVVLALRETASKAELIQAHKDHCDNSSQELTKCVALASSLVQELAAVRRQLNNTPAAPTDFVCQDHTG